MVSPTLKAAPNVKAATGSAGAATTRAGVPMAAPTVCTIGIAATPNEVATVGPVSVFIAAAVISDSEGTTPFGF